MPTDLTQYARFAVQPVAFDGKCFEPCDHDEAEQWALMGLNESNEADLVMDFGAREDAESFCQMLNRAAHARSLKFSLDYLLTQTVDADLAEGIALTEGEEDARQQALGAIERFAEAGQ